MKRTELARRSPLQADPDKTRAFRARSRPRQRRRTPAEAVWCAPVFARCELCRWSGRLARHHVTYRQHVRVEGGDEWALENSMLLCERCHSRHHSAVERILLSRVPDAAIAFAVDLFGEDRAELYLSRHYAPDDVPAGWRP